MDEPVSGDPRNDPRSPEELGPVDPSTRLIRRASELEGLSDADLVVLLHAVRAEFLQRGLGGYVPTPRKPSDDPVRDQARDQE